MKFIYLPTINLLIVFFNKSGSTLFGAWIENLVSFLGLPFELKTEMDIDYMEYIINVYEKRPKIYFFVRNPLERMITSFFGYIHLIYAQRLINIHWKSLFNLLIVSNSKLWNQMICIFFHKVGSW